MEDGFHHGIKNVLNCDSLTILTFYPLTILSLYPTSLCSVRILRYL